jgi:hypothetical protein
LVHGLKLTEDDGCPDTPGVPGLEERLGEQLGVDGEQSHQLLLPGLGQVPVAPRLPVLHTVYKYELGSKR